MHAHLLVGYVVDGLFRGLCYLSWIDSGYHVRHSYCYPHKTLTVVGQLDDNWPISTIFP